MVQQGGSVHQGRLPSTSLLVPIPHSPLISQDSTTPDELDTENDENDEHSPSTISIPSFSNANFASKWQANFNLLSSQSYATKPPLQSEIASPAESLRKFFENVRNTVDEYWSSWPGPDTCHYNAEIHARCQRVRSGEDLSLQQSVKLIESLHYRLAVMRTAEFYVRELDLMQNLDGVSYTHSNSEFWMQKKEQINYYTLSHIVGTQVFGLLTYGKPAVYLAMRMIDAAYSETAVVAACRWLIELYREISCADERSQVERAVREELAKIKDARALMEIEPVRMTAINSGKRKFNEAFVLDGGCEERPGL